MDVLFVSLIAFVAAIYAYGRGWKTGIETRRSDLYSCTHAELDEIDRQHSKAVIKHEFPQTFNNIPLCDVKKELSRVKQYNDLHYLGTSQVSVLVEEIMEAQEAYLEGRFDDCYTELAQCGAVILRMMNHVKSKKEKP